MNLSLLVGSCDKYSFIWDKFFTLFDKYWDHNITINKYFITEHKPAVHADFRPLCVGNYIWTKFARLALEQIPTDYILWMQDDYFLRKTIPAEEFSNYMKFVETNNVDRLGIHDNSTFYSYANNAGKLKQNGLYSISLQASIWNKKTLQSLLEQNDETNWQFEIDGTKRFNKIQHNVYISVQNPSWYLEALKQGSYTSDYFDICKEENL
jgi:hypothetical protein